MRKGPNWASIGSAQEALVGVRHNSTSCAAAQDGHARLTSWWLGGAERGGFRVVCPL